MALTLWCNVLPTRLKADPIAIFGSRDILHNCDGAGDIDPAGIMGPIGVSVAQLLRESV